MDDTLKFHLFYNTLFVVITVVALFFGYLCVTAIQMGFEELQMGNLYYSGIAIFLGIGWGFVAFILAYQLLYQLVKAYLDERTLKVPEICPECKEGLDASDVKWVEEKKAECPYCGVALRVTLGW